VSTPKGERKGPGALARKLGPRPVVFGIGLNTRDLDRSVSFYTRFLGMRETNRLSAPDLTEVILRSETPGSVRLLLVARRMSQSQASARSEPFEEHWGRIVFEVIGIEAVREQLMAAGYTVSEPQQPIDLSLPGPFPTVVRTADPDGHPLELIEIERA
jgi:catechol 2,3-dioxygenase-like lactoylglutathione lyase family enzyme